MFKKLLFLIAAALPFAASAQYSGTFTVNGKLAKVTKPLKAFLIYHQGNEDFVDSTMLLDGKFQFSGQITMPLIASVAIDHNNKGLQGLSEKDDIMNLYLEKGNIYINGIDSLSHATITGSALNEDNQVIAPKINSINSRAAALYKTIQAAKPDEQQSAVFQNSMQDKFKALQQERETVTRDFISNHPNSFLSVLALNSLTGPSANPVTIASLYGGLSADLKNSDAGKQLQQKINMLKVTGIGAMAPDFTQNDVDGKPVKLSSFRGKYVLLDFWASWCPPCRQESPNLVRAYSKFKDKNFTILSVSLDKPDAKAAWLNAIKADGLTWTNLSDLKFWSNEAAALYYVQSIPQNFLIDPTGKIIAKNLRGADLEGKLIEVFIKADKK